MNHMTGERSTFSELDPNFVGTIHFGDGSVVEIEGCGSAIFSCKNGEHRTLTTIYFIPRMHVNIINLGQLEEAGCRIILNQSIHSILEARRKMLAWVNAH
jgi:hypothetical protein